MKTVRYGDEDIECYQDSDLNAQMFREACERAGRLWKTRCDEFVAEKGHIGTAVAGAGFTVWYLPPRGKKPRRKMILHSPFPYQGSLVWESSKDEIKQFFENARINAHYEWGAMD